MFKHVCSLKTKKDGNNICLFIYLGKLQRLTKGIFNVTYITAPWPSPSSSPSLVPTVSFTIHTRQCLNELQKELYYTDNE